ncbi:methyltransferase domain-containing protein [Lentiprolixibacter aurantiacus]|uniref:Methyltransferase domain-containing protein n=1 Tax=Lentiprolixibacter aurantiacus TaxID=2993939 RepID=A0AAE3MLZ7_9FLAO|nr:methyltransferase domain-containing protein [Lentiprolixibacter aurantiacus]MCX2719648.1 methyltransferase domain-containing protein [Lentiprolixibacter aurantiacus]
MMVFKNRSTEAELMDDLSLDSAILDKVLRDVSRANRLLGGDRITRKAVFSILRSEQDRDYSITDVGCGDGAMLRQLAVICRNMKYRVKFIGLDINEMAIRLAQENSRDFPEITYHTADVMKDPNHGFSSDIVLCTLTLHHIPSGQIPQFIKSLAAMARKAVVVNDLQRSPLAYCLFKFFSAIFIKTKIARHDGLVSIKRGFKRSELMAFSRQVPAFIPEIKWKWAFRYLLILAPADRI